MALLVDAISRLPISLVTARPYRLVGETVKVTVTLVPWSVGASR